MIELHYFYQFMFQLNMMQGVQDQLVVYSGDGKLYHGFSLYYHQKVTK